MTWCLETVFIVFSIAENGGFDQKLKLRFSIFKIKAKNESKIWGQKFRTLKRKVWTKMALIF